MDVHTETNRHRWKDKQKQFEINQDSLSNDGPLDTKYLYYPHVEGVTARGSLSPASIYKLEHITIIIKIIINFSSYINFNLYNFNLPE